MSEPRDALQLKPNSSVLAGYDPFLLRRAVAPDLAPDVFGIAGYRENGCRLHHALEMAPLVVPLIIGFGEAFEIALGREPTKNDRYDSFTSGLYPGYVMINSTGHAECIQVDFTPLGAFRFFGMPMTEIASRMITLDDLGDRAVIELRLRLGEAADWHRRFILVERFLRARLLRARRESAPVAWAYEAILRGQGKVRVADLARALDWSRKHLNHRFQTEIGLGPKAVARMVRFNRALAIARTQGNDGWAAIAADCGYADQAHLVREFREFAGSSPGALPAFP